MTPLGRKKVLGGPHRPGWVKISSQQCVKEIVAQDPQRAPVEAVPQRRCLYPRSLRICFHWGSTEFLSRGTSRPSSRPHTWCRWGGCRSPSLPTWGEPRESQASVPHLSPTTQPTHSPVRPVQVGASSSCKGAIAFALPPPVIITYQMWGGLMMHYSLGLLIGRDNAPIPPTPPRRAGCS